MCMSDIAHTLRWGDQNCWLVAYRVTSKFSNLKLDTLILSLNFIIIYMYARQFL